MSIFPALAPRKGTSGPTYLDGWDLCSLGGLPLPGISRITGGKIRLKFDHKNKNGAHGARPTFCGLDPQEFGLEVTVWTQDQLDVLYDVCRLVLPSWNLESGASAASKKAAGQPIALQHPDVIHLGTVVNVVIVGATPLRPASGIPRGKMMTIELLHWQPPAQKASATSTPKTAVRQIHNKAREAREKPNPAPMSQPGAGAPPKITNE